MRWSIQTATAALSNAVSVAEGKSHLRVDFATDDTYIGNIIKAAEGLVQDYTNRKLIASTFDLKLDNFQKGGIVLPYSPVTAITYVKYYDADNTEQTWAATNYYTNLSEEPVMIDYVDGEYPDVYDNRSDNVTVRFVCGYTTVPEQLRQAILLLVGDMYEQRMDMPRERFTAWKALAYPYKVFF